MLLMPMQGTVRSWFIHGVILTFVLAIGACNQEKETDDVFGKSALAKGLGKWVKDGGDLDDVLGAAGDDAVKSRAEARAVCGALEALRAEPGRGGEKVVGSPLHTLTAMFQRVESQEAFDVLKEEGLPRLRGWVRDLIGDRDVDEDGVMFIMKVLAMYRQREDVGLIAEAARKPVKADGYMWSVILGQFDGEHPHSADMVEALRDPLPSEFILVAYLDMANELAIAGKLERHPFDSEVGRERLAAWLRDTDEEHFSYAHSATAALPFVDASLREALLAVADGHPDASVRMEAAWAQAECGDPAGLERLSKLCLDVRHSCVAQQYLEELGQSARIPEEAQGAEFQAVAEMAHWLAHPSEYGRPPDAIELYDMRELFWPPTNDRRTVGLVKYTYNEEEDGEPEHGVGMVGSITFALWGETTADLAPEDVYGLHCCWELEVNEDSRAPKERTAKAGREILGRDNDGF